MPIVKRKTRDTSLALFSSSDIQTHVVHIKNGVTATVNAGHIARGSDFIAFKYSLGVECHLQISTPSILDLKVRQQAPSLPVIESQPGDRLRHYCVVLPDRTGTLIVAHDDQWKGNDAVFYAHGCEFVRFRNSSRLKVFGLRWGVDFREVQEFIRTSRL